MSWQRKFNTDPTADAYMCEHILYPWRECFSCEKSRADWNEARVAVLEGALAKSARRADGVYKSRGWYCTVCEEHSDDGCREDCIRDAAQKNVDQSGKGGTDG